MTDYQALTEDIRVALNKNSAENPSGTPDNILADMLVEVLMSYDSALATRAKWRGEPVETGTWNIDQAGPVVKVMLP